MNFIFVKTDVFKALPGTNKINSFKEMKEIKKHKVPGLKKDDEISRREAMSRIGLSAFSVATMLLLLNTPGRAQVTSGDPDIPDTW